MVRVTWGMGPNSGSERAGAAYQRARAAIRAQERADAITGGTRAMGMWPELERAILAVMDGWRRPVVQPSTPEGAVSAPTRPHAPTRTRARYIGDPFQGASLSSPSRAELDNDWTTHGPAERGA